MGEDASNLIVLNASRLRTDFLSCFGHPSIKTTYIDLLADEGARFECCYSSSITPSSSQISFMTSTYPGEHSHLSSAARISTKVPNLVSVLKKAGYWTGMYGKNYCFHPDEAVKLWDEYDEFDLNSYAAHNSFKHAFSAFSLDNDHLYNRTSLITNELTGFIRRNKNRKFFGMLNFQDPEPAYCCPPPYDYLFDRDSVDLPVGWPNPEIKYEPRRNEVWRTHSEMRHCEERDIRRLIATYMGSVRFVDDMVGRITRALEDTQLLEKTVIVFMSNLGELLGYRGMVQRLPVFYDCLSKIPVIIRYPNGRWRKQRFQGLIEEIDIVPTLLDGLGLEIPPTMIGQSWINDLDLEQDTGKNTILTQDGIGAPTEQAPSTSHSMKLPDDLTFNGPAAMIRKDNWKLSIYADDVCELFDLEEDPHELKNLYEDFNFVDMREELTTDLAKRLLSLKVRPIRRNWPTEEFAVDVRQHPLDANLPQTDLDSPVKPEGTLQTIKRYITCTDATPRRRVESFVKQSRTPFRPTPSSSSAPKKTFNQILFICTGNHYRSRFAEAFFNYYADILNIRYSCFSRGLNPEKADSPISQVCVDAMAERDINPKYASPDKKPLTEEDLQRADRIIAMDDEEHREMIQEKFPTWVNEIEYWDAKDCEQENPEDSIQKIEKNVTELIKELDAQS